MELGALTITQYVILLFIIGLIIYVIIIFNGLVRLRNRNKKSWSNIDVLLKQRADELTKLIDTVKGYMKHERGVLETLTKARTDFLNAKNVSETASADNMISSALKTIFAVSENYPELKASDNFIQLQNRISGLENEIADRREFYNESVNTYNIRIQSFPDMFVARSMRYEDEDLFVVPEEDKKDVQIKFD